MSHPLTFTRIGSIIQLDILEFDEEVVYGEISWFLEWNEKVS